MLTTINLKCSNCGGILKISPEMEEFACGYCGVTQIVQRQGGTVFLRRVIDAISKIQVGTDKTAAELALRRLNEEIHDVESAYRVAQVKMIKARNERSNQFQDIGIFLSFIPLCGLITTYPSTAIVLTIVTTGGMYFFWRVSRQKRPGKTFTKHKFFRGRI